MGVMSQYTIRYFAAAAEAAGVDEEAWESDAPLALESLRAGLAQKYGAEMDRVLRAGSFLVGGVVRRDREALAEPVADGAVIDVLPPFAGG